MSSYILAPTHIYLKDYRRKEDPPSMFPPESLELAMNGRMLVAKAVDHTYHVDNGDPYVSGCQPRTGLCRCRATVG